jgi:hypothetical protein
MNLSEIVSHYFEYIETQKYCIHLFWANREHIYYAETRQYAEKLGDNFNSLIINSRRGELCAQRSSLKDKFTWIE